MISSSFAILIYTLYITSLFFIFLYGIHTILLIRKKRNSSQSLKSIPPFLLQPQLPTITIQLPIYNERLVIERLLSSVANIQWPADKLTIQILDDSTDETTEIIQRWMKNQPELSAQMIHLRRPNREGFKAGALKFGLEKTTSEFIAIFDSDFVPESDFLLKSMPYFIADDIGMVQTRWDHINRNQSNMTKVQAVNLDVHFLLEQWVRNQEGLFINFNGTGGVWRRTAIIDSGNWQYDTITEDLDLSYRAQLKGWKFIFRPDITCPAELPPEINAWKSQQFRWSKGAIETALKLIPQIVTSKISLKLKLSGLFHLLANAVHVFVVLLALLNIPMLLIREQSVLGNGLFHLLSFGFIAFVAGLGVYLMIRTKQGEKLWELLPWFPIFLSYNMGMSINNAHAVLQGLFRKKTEFVRTPKFNATRFPERLSIPSFYLSPKNQFQGFIELLMAGYCFFGLTLSIYYLEFSIFPFILLYGVGFFIVGWKTLRPITFN